MSDDYFVLLTEPHRETTAQANLMLRKVPFYLPTIYRPGYLSDRQHRAGMTHPDVTMPLFPMHIFVLASVWDAMAGIICRCPGMRYRPILRFGESLARLRPVDMEAVKRIEYEERAAYFAKKNKPALLPSWLPDVGQEVRFLVDAALGSLKGVVSEVDERGRVTILTNLLSRTVRINVKSDQIEPVNPEPAGATVKRQTAAQGAIVA